HGCGRTCSPRQSAFRSAIVPGVSGRPMNRREFVAVGAGGGALLVAGLGAVLGDGHLDDGPAYGTVATPSSSGTITLDNGLEASLYADGIVALFGASLTVDIEGGTAIAGRLRNVSERLLDEVRLR